MRLARPSLSLSLSLALAAAACGGASTGVVVDAPPATGGDVIGTIDVTEQRWLSFDGTTPMETRSGLVHAAFYDGGAPSFHRETMRAGDCVLKQYTPSSCEPFCDGVCVDTNVCEKWPTLVAAGRLTVGGLAVPLALPGTDGFYYPDAVLPSELFADDAAITADVAGGGGIPATTLATTGVPALAGAILGGKVILTPGQDAILHWQPAGAGARVRLTINANNQGHGQPYLAIIECDADDAAGQVFIPAAMVDAFPETRAWSVCAGSDCPPSRLRRYHRATVAVGDRDLELVVASEVAFGVDHILPR